MDVCMKQNKLSMLSMLHNSISTSNTRGHNFKLFKPQCSLDVRKYSYAYQVINVWNSLDGHVIIIVCKLSINFSPFP